MDFRTWEPIYMRILADFGISREADEEAARILSSLVDSPAHPAILRDILAGEDVSICGAAETLEQEIASIAGVVVAADEATSLLIRHDIRPDVIVTDLDGAVDDQIAASRQGTVTAIHAHGDNIETLRRHVPRFPGPVVPTTQAAPFDEVYNFGGFTDGDRAYFLAKTCGATSIKLLGYDFEHPARKPGKDTAVKQKKLRWARHLIETY